MRFLQILQCSRFFEETFKCFTLEDIAAKFPLDPGMLTLQKVNPCIIVPLKGKGRLNGLIVLGERINDLPFSETEREYLLNIASLAGIAIQNAYLYEMATTDMMTRLKIHHFFQAALVEERDRAVRNKRPLTLIMADIDHFKKFNDSYGHTCGDLVLINVAQALKENCRQIDLAARYGGEEMSVILPNTDLEAGIIAAERIRRSIEAARVVSNGQELQVTVSIGVAQFDPERDKNNTDIIERADKALYMSKQNGRNRVSFIR